MGDWIYYAAFLTMGDIAERVSLADEIHTHKGLRDMIQRQIDASSHAESIKTYLVSQPQRLFNALVIGVYGGSPDFYELSLKSSPKLDTNDLPANIEGALGILEFSGAEKMFAIDGQHRVVGMRRAVDAKPELKSEEVVALFVGHARDAKGMERSRRLFTTLNRYAKPVSKMDIIALDEDDLVAIITRKLIEEHPFFMKFLLVKKGKAIQVTDKRFFTTIEALYEVVDIFLRTDTLAWRTSKKIRPSEKVIKDEYEKIVQFWDLLIATFKPLKALSTSKLEDHMAAKFRNRTGGHLLFRPVGLIIVVSAIRSLLDKGFQLQAVLSALGKVPLMLTDAPWAGLLWDPTNKRMIMSADNRSVAQNLLLYGITGSGDVISKPKDNLRREWGGIVDKPISSMKLPVWSRVK
jgi:DNA sulfur modification protein DndB